VGSNGACVADGVHWRVGVSGVPGTVAVGRGVDSIEVVGAGVPGGTTVAVARVTDGVAVSEATGDTGPAAMVAAGTAGSGAGVVTGDAGMHESQRNKNAASGARRQGFFHGPQTPMDFNCPTPVPLPTTATSMRLVRRK